MFPPETLERMENVVTALAKNAPDQSGAGHTTSAAETGYALEDANRVLGQLKEARTALTLPVYKNVRGEADLTPEERRALADNDPVAGTEFRELVMLFVQMHGFACDVTQALGLCAMRLDARPSTAAKERTQGSDEDGPSHPPAWWPEEYTEETMHLMNARAQSLHDNTRAFTRTLRW